MNSKNAELSPILRLLLGGGGLVLLIAGMRASADVLNPFLLALIFAFVFGPTLGWMKQKGLPGPAALLLTLFLILGGGILLLLFLGTAVDSLVETLPTYQTSAQEQTDSLQSTLSDIGINSQSILQTFNPSKLLGVIGKILAEVISVGAATIFMLFILAFMLYETTGMSRRLSQPRLMNNPFIKRFTSFGADIRRYVMVLTWINLLVGLGDTVLLVILGVDYAVLWGLLAWFMGYIPSVGFWLALIPPVMLAYAESGPVTALIVFLGYVVINGSVQNIIQPKLMGDQLNLSPLVVIASLFIWTWVLGPLGALIAVPMTLAVQQLVLGSSEGSMWLADLMGAVPPAQESEDSAEVTAESE
ncbi:MAG: AI-2E family transporter [Candidatus Promineifilaceae bacterium]|jgi:predicted PurR-regulated permease PerM